MVISLAVFTLAGLDFRFGWSHEWLAPVPVWLVVVGQLIVCSGILVGLLGNENEQLRGQRNSGADRPASHPQRSVCNRKASHVFRHGGNSFGHAAGARIVRRFARICVVDPGSDLPLDSRGSISSSCSAGLQGILRATGSKPAFGWLRENVVSE
jgi:hypothetical protein